MNCGLFHLDVCASDAWTALTSFLFGWFWAIPWGWVIAGLIVGAILGAKFGWLAVISLGTSVLVGLIGPRLVSGPDNVTELEDGPDAEPQPKPRRRETPKPGSRTRFNHDTGKFESY